MTLCVYDEIKKYGGRTGQSYPAKIRKKSREKETYHMKRQKLLKVAGGALAAAMSLAMLAGCSGNTTSGSSSTGETGTASESGTAIAARPPPQTA